MDGRIDLTVLPDVRFLMKYGDVLKRGPSESRACHPYCRMSPPSINLRELQACAIRGTSI